VEDATILDFVRNSMEMHEI